MGSLLEAGEERVESWSGSPSDWEPRKTGNNNTILHNILHRENTKRQKPAHQGGDGDQE